jgi:phosphatidylserine/phosphatidylglycerophosphate/cardiolipin synthase-like enzyme
VSERAGNFSGKVLILGSIAAALVLVGAYLAAGGSSYEPKQVQDPCKPRPWSDPQSLGQIANQFTISALDGAACQLGVTRETLALALTTPERREQFEKRYGIDDEKLAKAIRAGLLRAVDDAEEAGALSPLIAVPLRQTLQRIPLDQAIEIINDAQGFLGDAESFLGPAQGVLEQLLPGGLGGLGLP